MYLSKHEDLRTQRIDCPLEGQDERSGMRNSGCTYLAKICIVLIRK